MYKKYFDAHFHWFDHSAFSDRLSSNIGDLDTKEYFLETYGRYGMTGGIMMGNGEIEKQGWLLLLCWSGSDCMHR